jgi:hypothetical protein
MRWSTNRRLEFIEARLYWEGKIGRNDLKDYFKISIPQATKDLKKYMEIAPDNTRYDYQSKHYITTESFKPTLISPDGDKFFLQLLVDDFTYDGGAFFCGPVPSFYKLPSLGRTVEPEILKVILRSIRNNYTIEIEYQSMASEEPSVRKISPHAFGFDGFRWHVRALCHKDKIYKDFIIGRIISIGKYEEFGFDHSNDFLWHNNIVLRIAPHPDFTSSQKKCIESDYGMKNGEVRYEFKASFDFYVLKKFGLTAGHEKKGCREQHIILLNQDEVKTKIELLKDISSKKIAEFIGKQQ